MPLCARCGNPFNCGCNTVPTQGPISGCPLKDAAIWVHVVDDRGIDVKGVKTKNDGAQEPTDPNGTAKYDPVEAGAHTVMLEPLSGELEKLFEKLPEDTSRKVTVAAGEVGYAQYQLTRKPSLFVKVAEKSPGTTVLGGAKVQISGKQTGEATTEPGTGIAKLGPVSAGTYTVKVTLSDDDSKKFATLIDFTATGLDVAPPLTPGEERTVVVEVEPLNLVTPKLEVEYKVALWERALSSHQPTADASKLFAEPTYVTLSLEETVPSHPYKGNVTLDHDGKLEFFKTRACIADEKLGTVFKAEDIRAAPDGKLKIWARGTAEGKFDLLAKLDEMKGPKIWTAKDPAKEEFGAVKLSMVIAPKEGASPFASKDMGEGDKIGKGAVVHAQDAKNFGRLKAIIKALDAAKWPGGTGDYEVVLSGGSSGGKVKIFDAATEGNEITPAKFKVSSLTVDKVIWIEGATESDAARDSVLDAGIVNGGGDLKRYADWANFTVVKLEAVKPSTQFPTETTAYTAGNYRHYVNQGDKRKIKVKAKLTKDLVGIKLNFIVLGDENNQKQANWGEDMPATWTPASWPEDLKPDDQAAGVHVSATTIAGGIAEAEVKLSIIGGDKFHVGAFVDECAHFRTVKKKETDKPAPVLSKPLQVWRKFWYQTTHGNASIVPPMAAAISAMAKVKIEMELSKDVSFDASALPSTVVGVFYKEWQLQSGGTETEKFVIGTHNSDYFRGQFDTSGGQAPIVNIMVCDAQWDGLVKYTDGTTAPMTSGAVGPIDVKSYSDAATRTTAEFRVPLPNKRAIINPPLSGGDLLVSGTWQSHDGAQNGTLSNADLVVEKSRTSLSHLKVKLPSTAPTPTATEPVKITLNVKIGSGSWLGESDGAHILAVIPKPAVMYDFCDTVVHEVGHSFNQARGSSSHPVLPAGVTAHTVRYDENGSHCHNGSTGGNVTPPAPCVMWASGPQANGIRCFCKVCHPFMLIDEVKPF